MDKEIHDGVRLLIVDDEPVVRKSLRSWLEEEGYRVEVAESGKEALQRLNEAQWDIFLVDIKMPGMDGLELQHKIMEAQPSAAVVIMTAFASAETAVKAMKQGAYDYIVKPFEPENLDHIIRNAMERKSLLVENARLKDSIDAQQILHGIVGNSPAIQRVLEEVEMVASSDTTVLIRGESGTGKELVARAVHACSRRRYMPVVVVNCGALSEGILESELFGHERGAFTGAQYQRKGKFEIADGGTLFLDEIGDISLRTQVDLLRVLDEKHITRVGGNTPIPVDFRLVTATNRDIERMLSEEKFREDLYFRINVFSITIPPLRERREDIPPLFRHFVEKLSRSMNKPIEGVSAEALSRVQGHDWPGNVRELQNAAERAVIVCKGSEIGIDELSIPGVAYRPQVDEKSLSSIERRHILDILSETGWNITHAARVLSIDRVTLYNKIRKYGLKRSGSS